MDNNNNQTLLNILRKQRINLSKLVYVNVKSIIRYNLEVRTNHNKLHTTRKINTKKIMKKFIANTKKG